MQFKFITSIIRLLKFKLIHNTNIRTHCFESLDLKFIQVR